MTDRLYRSHDLDTILIVSPIPHANWLDFAYQMGSTVWLVGHFSIKGFAGKVGFLWLYPKEMASAAAETISRIESYYCRNSFGRLKSNKTIIIVIFGGINYQCGINKSTLIQSFENKHSAIGPNKFHYLPRSPLKCRTDYFIVAVSTQT